MIKYIGTNDQVVKVNTDKLTKNIQSVREESKASITQIDKILT